MAWSQQQMDALNGTSNAVTPNQASQAYGNSNSFLQQMVSATSQPQAQPTQAPAMNSTGSEVAPQPSSGGGMFSNLVNNIKKVPGQLTDLASKITGPGSGMNTAVQDLGQTEATMYQAGKALNPFNSPQVQDQAMQAATSIGAPSPLKAAEAGAEIAAVIPGEMGAAGATTKAATEKGSELMASVADKKATQTAIKALTPKMTSGELEAAGAAGKGVVPKIGAPSINQTKDSGFMKMVNATKGLIKGKSPIEDINSVRGALSTEADALKSKIVASGKDVIYPFQELASKISDADEPISLKGTAFEKQIAPLKQAAIQIAQKNGGTISSLFDTRKEFDALVDKTWPNLWDKENAPMRNAVTAVRNTMNDFIEKSLPDAGYKASLEKQSTYYKAIDNLATKVPDEIKGGATFAKRHPVVTGAAKVLGGGAVAGLGLTGAEDAVKKLGF